MAMVCRHPKRREESKNLQKFVRANFQYGCAFWNRGGYTAKLFKVVLHNKITEQIQSNAASTVYPREILLKLRSLFSLHYDFNSVDVRWCIRVY